MDKIKIKGIPFKLKGEVNLMGKIINFEAIDRNKNDFELDSVPGKKVISIFPKLNTSVCDQQTIWIAKNANKFNEYNFISITTDGVETINKWCVDKGLENVNIVSDKKYKDFGDKTNLLIPKAKMLARGFLVLDENNTVLKEIFKKELSDDPDFEALEDALTA